MLRVSFILDCAALSEVGSKLCCHPERSVSEVEGSNRLEYSVGDPSASLRMIDAMLYSTLKVKAL